MIRTARARTRPTRGENLRIAAFILGGIAGALLCLASVDALDPPDTMAASSLWGPFLWRLMAGFIGTIGILWLCRGRFGWPGPRGWLAMGQGVVLVTVFAPVAAGTLVLPFYGTMFGPLALVITLLHRPLLALVWFGTLVAGHRMAMVYREERATIFASRRRPAEV